MSGVIRADAANMKKILITGVNGLLGQALSRTFSDNFEVYSAAIEPSPALELPHYEQLDISDPKKCKKLIWQIEPDVIINAAAFTNVDACEEEKELCWRINVKGVENLAAAARRNMALLVHLSTDYIFDGKEGPYPEEYKPKPLGYYGKSKLASENAVRIAGIPYAIVRTNVLYGAGINVKNNFFLWLYHSLQANKQIRVVTDQLNNPTLAEELAEGIQLLIKASKYGIYNIAGAEYLSRYDFALKVAEVFGFSTKLIAPITTDQLMQKSPRPMRGGLRIEKAKTELGYRPKPITEILEYLGRKMEAAG